MYKNYKTYEALEKRRIPVYSEIGIVLNPDVENISSSEILQKLDNSNLFKKVNLKQEGNEISGIVEFLEEDYYKIKISIIEQDNTPDELENIDVLSIVNNIEEKEREKWKKSKYTIVLELKFKEDVPADTCYTKQLLILDIINPNYVVMFDMSAQKVISAKWVKMLLEDNLLPLNDYLFSVHTSYDSENNDLWLHTHGLNRCGSIELEMLGLTKESTENLNILTSIARKFIEEGTSSQNEPIKAGYSSNEYLNYVWRPWEESIKIYAKKGLFKKSQGFLGCLEDRDIYHSFPSGVLFAYKNNKIEKPIVNSLLLKNGLACFFTNRETEKIIATAKVRINHLFKIFEKHGEEFKYLVKVGIKHGDQDDREYLWFNIDCINSESNKLRGTLLNSPYHVENMKQGETYTVNKEDISDWNIYTSDNTYFNADNIYRYYQ